MTHEVFISYSHHDKVIADGVCANLEQAGIRCWIAPRDIAPGHDWPTSISEAIRAGRVMVLIFSSRSNSSDDVGRELILAANNKLIIVPFRIEDVLPEPGKEYYLARTHWLDAMDPPTQEQIDKLVSCVHALLVEAGVELVVKPPGKQAPAPPEVQRLPPLPVTTGEQAAAAGPVDSPKQAATTSPISTKKRASLPLGVTLGLVFGSLALLIIILFLFRESLNLPAMSAVFSQPTPTLTHTFTRTPTSTHTPTSTKTRPPTLDYTAIIEQQIESFAEPILTDVLSRKPNHEADFSTYDPKWSLSPLVRFTDGVMHLRVPDGSGGEVRGEHISADDFVIQFDFSPVIMGSSDWVGYRFRYNDTQTVGFDFRYSLDGSWSFEFADLTIPHVDQFSHGWTVRTTFGQVRTVLLIVQGYQMAFYLDGQPVGYGVNASHFDGGQNWLFVESSSGNNIEVDFDNIKFWDLSALNP